MKPNMKKIRRTIIIDSIVLLIIHVGLRIIRSVVENPPADINWEKLESYFVYILLIALIRFAIAWVFPLFIGKDPIRRGAGGGVTIPITKLGLLLLAFIVYMFVLTPFHELVQEIKERIRKTDRASLKASSRPFVERYSVKTGIKEIVREPSAKSLRRRFGILNATKKASAARLAPKNQATMTSRTKPRIRLNRVAAPMIPAFRIRLSAGFFCEAGFI